MWLWSLLLVGNTAEALFGPASVGCSQEGCDPGRSFFASGVRVPGQARLAWTDKNAAFGGPDGAWGCSTSDAQILCSRSNAKGLAAYNGSGHPMWGSSQLGGNATYAGAAPLITEGGLGASIAALDDDSFAVLSASEGITALAGPSDTYTHPSLLAHALGPALIEQQGGDYVVLFVDRSGELVAWSAETQSCWAAMYVCAEHNATNPVYCETDPSRYGFLLPVATPSINGTRGYLAARRVGGGVDTGDAPSSYVTAIVTGSIVGRLTVSWRLRVPGTLVSGAQVIGDNIVVVQTCNDTACQVVAVADEGDYGRLMWIAPRGTNVGNRVVAALAADPRGGVWIWSAAGSAGGAPSLRRLSARDGAVVQVVELPASLARPVTHFTIGDSNPPVLVAGFEEVASSKIAPAHVVVSVSLATENETENKSAVLWTYRVRGSIQTKQIALFPGPPSSLVVLSTTEEGLIALG